MGLFDGVRQGKIINKKNNREKILNFNNISNDKNLKYIIENKSSIGDYRKDIIKSIEIECLGSNNPYDVLALAIALNWKGAKFRKESIFYYEKFLDTKINIYYEHKYVQSDIYTDLAKLYMKEKEYDKIPYLLNNAISCASSTRLLIPIYSYYTDYFIATKAYNEGIKYFENILHSSLCTDDRFAKNNKHYIANNIKKIKSAKYGT